MNFDENKQQILEQQKDYRDANREQIREKDKSWYDANRELILKLKIGLEQLCQLIFLAIAMMY